MKPVLRTEGLTRILPGEVPVTLVQDITLDIQRGEFVAVMGPSGSGKSSLLYLLGLLDKPTGGRIWLDEIDTAGMDEDALARLRLERLGFVFQFHFLLAEFSALDNVMLPMRKLGRLGEEAARARGRSASRFSETTTSTFASRAPSSAIAMHFSGSLDAGTTIADPPAAFSGTGTPSGTVTIRCSSTPACRSSSVTYREIAINRSGCLYFHCDPSEWPTGNATRRATTSGARANSAP